MDMFFLQLLNGSDSVFLDRFSVALTSGYTWIAFYVALAVLVVKNNKTMAQIILIFACALLCVLASGIFNDLVVKPYFMHLRPCFDPEVYNVVKTVPEYSVKGYSFFSSHAANAMSLTMFFALLVRSKRLIIIMLAWTLVSSWTRLYLGVHWFSDVAVGFAWGLVIGIIVYILYYKIYFKISPKLNFISSHYTSTGYCKTDIDICMSVMAMTVIYCLFRVVI